MPEPAKRTGGVNSFSGEFLLLPDDDFLHAFFGLTLDPDLMLLPF
jgi:hypothetical protein